MLKLVILEGRGERERKRKNNEETDAIWITWKVAGKVNSGDLTSLTIVPLQSITFPVDMIIRLSQWLTNW